MYMESSSASFDDGDNWIRADEETFPTAGVDIQFDYPDAAGVDEYDYVAAHLITKSINGAEEGEIEFFAPEKKQEGLTVHVDSVSPFALGWKKTEEAGSEGGTSGEPSGGESDGAISDSTPGGGSASGKAKSQSARSGDSAPVAQIIVVMALAGAMLAVLLIRRKK